MELGKVLPYLMPVIAIIITTIIGVIGYFLRSSFLEIKENNKELKDANREIKENNKEILDKISGISLSFAEMKGEHKNNTKNLDDLEKKIAELNNKFFDLNNKVISLEVKIK